MKWIYVCSPYSGDVENNVVKARACCREVLKQGFAPIAPHLLFPQFLDDTNPDEREQGIEMGLDLLNRCQELWAFGETISTGMKAEIQYAKEHGIPVRRMRMPE